MKMAFIIVVCFAWSGVWAQTNTKLSGKLKDLKDGTKVYLSPLGSSSKKDSTVATKGKFEFNLTLNEGDIYLLQIGKVVTATGAFNLFYLEPGNLKIKASGPLLKGTEFSGSKIANDQDQLNKFIKNSKELKDLEQLTDDISQAMKDKDSVKVNALLPKYRKLDSVRTNLYREWVTAHTSSPVSAMVLAFYAPERNMDRLQELLDQLDPAAKKNAVAKRMQYSIDVSKATAIGKMAPDFIQNDPDGKPIALKDFRGKYVLVDFWASWCVPCRAENPHLVKAYNNLKEKNFTVLGVSLDRPNAKDKWIKAIEDDHLTWFHVSDLKFWDNEVARMYDIKSIPQNLLIGPDGVILEKNLRGENVEEKLREFIK